MKLNKIFMSFFIILNLYSLSTCSHKSKGSKNNGGPPQCLASGFANFSDSSIVPSPTSFQMSGYFKSFLVENKSLGDFGISGGTAVSGFGLPAGSNTVAILLSNAGSHSLTQLCSGSVVASNLILTAAHCFNSVDWSNPSPGIVVFSNNYASISSLNSLTISCWQRVSDFVNCTDNLCSLNDIAWVKINGNVNVFSYSPVSLLTNPKAINVSETKWISGFGRIDENTLNSFNQKYIYDTSSQGSPDIPPSSDALTEFNRTTFENAYESYLTVFGPYYGHGSCFGDSGGPAYVLRNGNYILAALVQGTNSLITPKPSGNYPFSFDYSTTASCTDGYGVYTTVGNYLNWITSSSGVSLATYP